MIIINSGKMIIPEKERFIGFAGDNLHIRKQFSLDSVHDENAIYRLYLSFDDGTANYFALDSKIADGSTILSWDVKTDHIFKSGIVQAQIKVFCADNEVYHTTSDYFIVGDSVEFSDYFSDKENSEFLEYEKLLNEMVDFINGHKTSSDSVPSSRTIAGLALNSDITTAALKGALNIGSPVTGRGAPTKTTQARPLTVYTDENTNKTYMCIGSTTNGVEQSYQWIEISSDLSGCENLSNKVTSISDEPTNDSYPTEKAVFNFGNQIFSTLVTMINKMQSLSAKVTGIDENSTDWEYPSAKAVYDYVSGLDLNDNNAYAINSNIRMINHRGYNRVAPENTLPAFKLSAQMGFNTVETDVRFTQDGVAVLLHDDTIDRTSNGTGAIRSMTFEQARSYDFGSWKSEEYAGTKIPTFEEFLSFLYRHDLNAYVELETGTQAQILSLFNMAESFGMKDRITWICGGSNAQSFLGYITSKYEKARVGLVLQSVTPEKIAIMQSLKTGKNEVFADVLYTGVDRSTVQQLIDADIPLEVWTLNDVTFLPRLSPYVTGVTTNYLDVVSEMQGDVMLESISINTAPTKTVYTAGETFNDSGLKLTANYSDGTSKTIRSGWYVTPNRPLTATDTSVSVSFSDYGITKSVKQPITVTIESVDIVPWSSGTDEEIADMIAALNAGVISIEDTGWNIGDERTVSLAAMEAAGVGESHVAQEVTMVLMDSGHYTLAAPTAAGRTVDHFVVGLKNVLANGTTREGGYMNSGAVSVGSWDSCARRTWCNNVFYNAVPETLRGIFKPFNVITASEYNSEVNTTSVDKFSLFAEVEIFGERTYSNETEANALSQIQYYEGSSAKIKKAGDNGAATSWWERSPNSQDSYGFCRVHSEGSANKAASNGAMGLAPFGCI